LFSRLELPYRRLQLDASLVFSFRAFSLCGSAFLLSGSLVFDPILFSGSFSSAYRRKPFICDVFRQFDKVNLRNSPRSSDYDPIGFYMGDGCIFVFFAANRLEVLSHRE
jgi:hypothetical protein